jgi:hypothetical protein
MLKNLLTENPTKNIRFRTFKVLPKNNPANVSGRITCAIEKINTRKFKVDFSFCGPEEQYCKTYGQFVSLARLINGDRQISINKRRMTDKVAKLIADSIIRKPNREVKWLKKEDSYYLV